LPAQVIHRSYLGLVFIHHNIIGTFQKAGGGACLYMVIAVTGAGEL
jgi:hypothetical protein